jgi:hypothetical protein
MSVNGLVACATAATIVASVGVIARAYKKDPGAAETSVIPNEDSVPNIRAGVISPGLKVKASRNLLTQLSRS